MEGGQVQSSILVRNMLLFKAQGRG